MASLNKLAIRGIRSFDDKQISIIEFFSPVTVIVGHNGSGKTTIIECLKYATTGDQPPNTRGGAFVHDPKMANEKEVKAQVKLRFHAANGTRMLAVRNLSVTVKKTGLTMKTLESILAIAEGDADKGGKRGVISTKCAEMDTEIPQLLGVSKAVLENVIFCHQEDSYWPLAEPSTLKKKFDDIFEATRYTKALDSIKNLRKDRVMELKAEKERLLSLSREKSHSDKLKDRFNELKSTIAAKEVEYEDSKHQYDAAVKANQKFYELFSKFREMYSTVAMLEENKARTKKHLTDLKSKYQELPGKWFELESRAEQFEDKVNTHKENKCQEERKLEDLEGGLRRQTDQQRTLLDKKGRLNAEAEEQSRRIQQREQAIREIGEMYAIKGFSHSPLERDQVLDFVARLRDVHRKQQLEYEKRQTELKGKSDEYHAKLRVLDTELESRKSQKQHLRRQTVELQEKIRKTERMLEGMQTIPTSLRTLQVEIADRKERLQKLNHTLASAKYDVKLADMATKGRKLEDERDQLNTELQALTSQADARARLDLKRAESKSKGTEAQTNMDFANAQLKKLMREETDMGSIEDVVDQLIVEYEEKQSTLSGESKISNAKLQKVDLELSNLKTLLTQKKTDLRNTQNKIKHILFNEEYKDATEALRTADIELDERKRCIKQLHGEHVGTIAVYQALLKHGRENKICNACSRHLNDAEFVAFEKHMQGTLTKVTSKSLAEIQEELDGWEAEHRRLQALRPLNNSVVELTLKEIPSLEEQIKEKETTRPHLVESAESACENLELVTRDLKQINSLKDLTNTILRLQKESDKAKHECDQLERNLSSSGSNRTADDVQTELGRITSDIRKNDRDSKALSSEADRQTKAIRDLENNLHSMELDERDLLNKVKDKERLEKDILHTTEEVADYAAQSKEIDSKISEAEAPINALQETYQRQQRDLNTKISDAQRLYEDLSKCSDRLNDMNKNVERYVKEKKGRMLEECSSQLEQCDTQLHEMKVRIEACRSVIASISKEINESGATISNLRDNIIVQNLTRDIAKTQAEIDSYDMEEAGKARRNYEDKYEPAKAREDGLGEKYHRLTGELSTLKAQLKSLENDLKEFKDVYKKYTDQLIRVKVSDMANSDLEKYAKALDNAIMKYHGLKMEEVNDTMKHLWNKTYQGTDIDGIKIRSDVEGAASKRSYNYRVVMTKDQVEMDMRGRCSAGQKMLASIIIRLALSDSFGQNCGILALDEPTNALDTENIDALAASLVDIINERKTHSNFQLIIITHDENFLRKLGQSDVMEYYWRVSRDSRQKSIIDRQRFR
ncbi:hypothetical protein HYPSUDRAFT_141004 [Hypholoma sublateritium FD-334 SS-4]|uniref:DNA repair protein RAD50 n=1 Tax=Hypholoma sublateritium (strain FD-334 SS-4) TaxID=945553 RepID=A0A0D2MCM4_HYPSF|nr:hypothetical protein HYPSUDRAFT_141004 [Hypholoma sublateritium FD-334 SS-4]